LLALVGSLFLSSALGVGWSRTREAYDEPILREPAINLDAQRSRPLVQKSIYHQEFKDIFGNPVYMRDYFNKLCIIVNVATRSGMSQDEYSKLNQLYERYHDYGLEILAFPCDNFNHCPDENELILQWHEEIMKAKFPIMEKISVNPNNYEEVGENTSPPNEHPLYTFLKNATDGQAIPMDYQTKFIVLPMGRIWRFNDRYLFRTITLEQFIRRKWNIDTDSTATTIEVDTDEEKQRKVENCGVEFPRYEGIKFNIQLGKSYGDKTLDYVLKQGRWPFNRPK